jgi:hypothetical protein
MMCERYLEIKFICIISYNIAPTSVWRLSFQALLARQEHRTEPKTNIIMTASNILQTYAHRAGNLEHLFVTNLIISQIYRTGFTLPFMLLSLH